MALIQENSLSFTTLPVEIYRDLKPYLCSDDLIALSQTNQFLRHVYAPLSWEVCFLIDETVYDIQDTCTSMVGLACHLPRSKARYLPVEIFDSYTKYSWFRRASVKHISLDYLRSDLFFRRYHQKWNQYLDACQNLRYMTYSLGTAIDSLKMLTDFLACTSQTNIQTPLSVSLRTGRKYNFSDPKTFSIPNLNFTKLTITDGYFIYEKESLIGYFPQQKLDKIDLTIENPSVFREFLSVISHVKYCRKMILRMLVKQTENDVFAISKIATMINEIPASVKEVKLIFSQYGFLDHTNFEYSGTEEDPNYIWSFELDIQKKTYFLDRVTEIKLIENRIPFLNNTFFKWFKFPNLSAITGCIPLEKTTYLNDKLCLTKLEITVRSFFCQNPDLHFSSTLFPNLEQVVIKHIGNFEGLHRCEAYRDWVTKILHSSFDEIKKLEDDDPKEKKWEKRLLQKYMNTFKYGYLRYQEAAKILENQIHPFVDFKPNDGTMAGLNLLLTMDTILLDLRHLRKLRSIKLDTRLCRSYLEPRAQYLKAQVPSLLFIEATCNPYEYCCRQREKMDINILQSKRIRKYKALSQYARSPYVI